MQLTSLITIGSPCHEDWNQMTPVQQGRFCDACSKCVIDLNGKSQAEIHRIFLENDGELCGSMPAKQYQEDLNLIKGTRATTPTQPQPGPGFFKKTQVFAIALIATFGIFTTSYAQAPHKKHHVKGKIAYHHRNELQITVTLDGKITPGIKVTATSTQNSLQKEALSNEKGQANIHRLSLGTWTIAAHGPNRAFEQKTIKIDQSGLKKIKLKLSSPTIFGDTILVAPIDPEMVAGAMLPIPIEPETPALQIPEIAKSPKEIPACKCLHDKPINMIKNPFSQIPDHNTTSAESPKAQQPETSFELSAYPLPSRDELNIRIEQSLGNEPVNLMLFNQEGQLIQTASMNGNIGSVHKINIQTWSAGIYYLKGIQGAQLTEQKILKL